MAELLKPKTVTVKDMDGKEITVIISRLPGLVQREIAAKYPVSALPKLGDYGVNEEMALKMLSYCAVTVKDGVDIRLTTRDLIQNHLGDLRAIGSVELEVVKYNFDFFGSGSLSSFWDDLGRKAITWTIKTWMELSPQLLKAAKQHSTNSAPSMTPKT